MSEKLHPNHIEVVRKASGSETATESSDMIIVVWKNNGNSYSLSSFTKEGGILSMNVTISGSFYVWFACYKTFYICLCLESLHSNVLFLFFYHLSPKPFMNSAINGIDETKFHNNNLQSIMISRLGCNLFLTLIYCQT